LPVQNIEIARMLNKLADLLEIDGAGAFRVRAYREAAESVENQSRSLTDMVTEGKDLSSLPGIGASMADKIEEIVRTGRLAQLEEQQKKTPETLTDLLNLPGLGPKRVQTIYKKLGIKTIKDLEKAARDKSLRDLPGFGVKLEQEILEKLDLNKGFGKRMLLVEVDPEAERLVDYLRGHKGVVRAEVAGSVRRRKETVGDLDLVAVSKDPEEVMEHFVGYEGTKKILSQGETRSSLLLRSGLQADLRVVDEDSFGAALFYFTGSKAHNLYLKRIGVEKGWKTNEYGVYQGDKKIAGRTEMEFYKIFDLPYIEPELREERGEVQAAREGKLPDLIQLEDLRGDLQMHTTASDGRATLEEMAEAASERGLKYIAITDHSKHIAIVNGMTEEQLLRQIETIDRLNEKLKGLVVLKGVEVDILPNGSLALPDDILRRLDLCVASIHADFNLTKEKQTSRVLKAMDNPFVHGLGHPTGRKIGRREPLNLDMEKLMRAAYERGCFLEINADPHRLDLNDINCKMAKEMGIKLVISTDAHRISELDNLRYGVDTARRGWLEAKDVLNTNSLKAFQKLVKRE
jgi:DNA polymerase (family X)